MQNTRKLGREFEEIACNYLLTQGFKILKKNFVFGKTGEIDIIAEKKGIIRFIEVKARNTADFGSALDSITPHKVNALTKAAEGWLYINKIEDKPCQFDIIVINKIDSILNIKLIENAI
jgi:putative endonuclease